VPSVARYLDTKNQNFVLIWKALELKMLVYIFYGSLLYVVAIWYIYGHLSTLWSFGIFFHVLVHCALKNLATLILEHFFPKLENPKLENLFCGRNAFQIIDVTNHFK
jgi:hypothetical protein